jgi:hypothetical protein
MKEAARSGKSIVGDKSPQHTECLDEIHDLYPEARVIHVIRDGRDVAISTMNHWWRLAQDQEGGVFTLTPEELKRRDAYLANREEFLSSGRSIFAEERLSQLARRWSYRVEKARREGRKLYGDKCLEVRYERLLKDPRGEVRTAAEFLGARAFDEATVERCVEMGSFRVAAQRERGEEDAGSFFRKGVAGDWQAIFTARDRELYWRIAGGLLAELGYEENGDR